MNVREREDSVYRRETIIIGIIGELVSRFRGYKDFPIPKAIGIHQVRRLGVHHIDFRVPPSLLDMKAMKTMIIVGIIGESLLPVT